MNSDRLYPTLLIIAGGAALATASVAQYGFGFDPCVLCLYQRVPFALAIVLGTVGLVRPRWLAVVFALAALAFAANGVLAVYHVGVEQHLWVSAAGCGGQLPTQISVADLIASLDQKRPKPCDAVDWTLFGVSMAGWNVVYSFALAGASAYVLRTHKWPRHR